MTCKEYRQRMEVLEDFLDGRLSGPAAGVVEAHLEACAVCRGALEEARLGMALLRTSLEPAPVPGDEFWLRVRPGIVAEEETARFWQPFEALAWRFSMGAALVVALMSGYVLALETRLKDPLAQAEVREIFRDPAIQPADHDEVLMTLASKGNGR